jgi:glycosyltransferase involved in cell wall biosynthesis
MPKASAWVSAPQAPSDVHPKGIQTKQDRSIWLLTSRNIGRRRPSFSHRARLATCGAVGWPGEEGAANQVARGTIFINGRFLEQRVTGVQRFAFEVLSALDELLDAEPASTPCSIVVLAPHGARPVALRRICVRHVGPLHGHAWEQCTLPAVTRGAPLLGFGPTGPLAQRNQVVTIHDAAVRAVPASYGKRFRALYEVLLPALVRRSEVVMTVSEFSKSELIRHFAARPGQLRVTGEGWEHILRVEPDPRILTKHGLERHKYLLAVSSITPSKNFAVIARALARLPRDSGVQVAVAGAVDPRMFADARVPRREAMRWLGYVTDGELRALYANAAAFVFPSLYEGFGLPPLEAMALDCPVLASNAAALPEVCGDAALYFSPSDEVALAVLMARMTSDEAVREGLIGRGRQRLLSYGWKRAASVYLSLIRDWKVQASSKAVGARVRPKVRPPRFGVA